MVGVRRDGEVKSRDRDRTVGLEEMNANMYADGKCMDWSLFTEVLGRLPFHIHKLY